MTVTEIDLAALRWIRMAAQDGSAREIREEARITILELAERVGVSAAAISRWERGNRVPRGAAARAYAAVLLDLQATAGLKEVNPRPAA
jgi:transcriptional regulator with XRE-family HTH domain